MRSNHPFTLLALTLALALPALAQTAPAPQAPAQREGRSFEKMHERMAEQLKLTDAQKASCKAIIGKHHSSLMAKHKAAKEARRAFFEAVQNPGATPETLKALNRAMADARLEAMLEGRAMRQELRAVLTPEQREKAAFMMGRQSAKRMGHGGWEGMGMGEGPGRHDMGGCACAPGKAE